MQGNFFRLKPDCTNEQLKQMHHFVSEQVDRYVHDGKQCYVKVDEYTSPRTLPANRLYWKWLDEISEYLTKRKYDAQSHDLHDLMKHKFLGYHEPKKVGQTLIEKRLRSTRTLSKTDFCSYMEKVEAWAFNIGCIVTTPALSEYQQYLDRQNT